MTSEWISKNNSSEKCTAGRLWCHFAHGPRQKGRNVKDSRAAAFNWVTDSKSLRMGAEKCFTLSRVFGLKQCCPIEI